MPASGFLFLLTRFIKSQLSLLFLRLLVVTLHAQWRGLLQISWRSQERHVRPLGVRGHCREELFLGNVGQVRHAMTKGFASARTRTSLFIFGKVGPTGGTLR
jgi:hypothetical protein